MEEGGRRAAQSWKKWWKGEGVTELEGKWRKGEVNGVTELGGKWRKGGGVNGVTELEGKWRNAGRMRRRGPHNWKGTGGMGREEGAAELEVNWRKGERGAHSME